MLPLRVLLLVGVAGLACGELVRIECCDLWHAVTKFVSVNTGEDISNTCPDQCLHAPVIQSVFKNIYPTLVEAEGAFVMNSTSILTSPHLSDVLAWSILGRLCAVHKFTSNHADFLEFHTGSQTLHIRRSGCEYQKIMYATLLGFCIVILSFVLAVGILKRPVNVHEERQEEEQEARKEELGGEGPFETAQLISFGTRSSIRYRALGSGP